ncbi:MAG TPA: site-2 protease family protein [Bryobacteraceae bacterium]|nr:site-2 protease family protein [Bryobacteraceae bacterium]
MTPEQRANVRSSGSGSMGTFRLMGVPVRLHFTFVLLLIFLLVSGFGTNQSGWNYAVYVIALFASVLLHELAHAWAGSHYGINTLEIVMFPIGGVSRMQRTAKPQEEFWIAASGPFVNLLIGFALFAYLYAERSIVALPQLVEPTNANLIERIAFGNLILAFFNFLPAFPMDGGRMLRAILSRFKSEDEATRIAAWAGRMLAISMGLYGLLSSHFMLVFVAFFVYLGAAQESAAALGRSLTSGIPVRAAMLTDYKTLDHGSTIRDAANLLLATSQQDFPIMHADQVLGLLHRNALLRAMASDGPDAYVAGFMDRDYTVLNPEMNLADVLPVMARSGSCALVMQDDKLVGLLTAENLSQFLLLRRFGMEPTIERG